jgi:hypothetical protein
MHDIAVRNKLFLILYASTGMTFVPRKSADPPDLLCEDVKEPVANGSNISAVRCNTTATSNYVCARILETQCPRVLPSAVA